MRCGLSVLVLAILLPQMSALAAGPAALTPGTLQHDLDAVVAAGVPGGFALVRDGDESWTGSSGLADPAGTEAPDAAGRYRIGSVTKSFVATVVLQLIAEGKLRLDDNVETFFPHLLPNGRRVTIRHLLQMRSGLFDYTNDPRLLGGVPLEELRNRSVDPEWLVKLAVSHGPLFPPGSQGVYSNTNYVVLGMIIQKVTRTDVETQLWRRIFLPLQLEQTELPQDDPFLRGNATRGFTDAGDGLVEATDGLNPSMLSTAGAIVSTTEEVAHFYRALLSGRLLRPPQLALMTAARPLDNGVPYGLGLVVLPTACGAIVGHDGSVPGYLNFAFRSADGTREIVVVLNTDTPADSDAVDRAVVTLLLDALCPGTPAAAGAPGPDLLSSLRSLRSLR
jgi:D-alanyl-D-alanine carboxypeptidase